MTVAHITKVSRDFNVSKDQLFTHWTSPKARSRWEANRTETNSEYVNFDTRTNGEEIFLLFGSDGSEIGKCYNQYALVKENEEIVVSTRMEFAGEIVMLINLFTRFEESSKGSRLTITAQIISINEMHKEEDQEKGWNWILDRFEDDLKQYGGMG